MSKNKLNKNEEIVVANEETREDFKPTTDVVVEEVEIATSLEEVEAPKEELRTLPKINVRFNTNQ